MGVISGGWFNCPWCNESFDACELFGLEEGNFKTRCRACGKPIVVDVDVTIDARAGRDKAEIEAELEKYKKRMRGDWS